MGTWQMLMVIGVDGMDRHHRPTRLSELLDEDEKKDLEEELESAV
jgi:hypothetical protein